VNILELDMFLLYLFILGAVFGSFINVLVFRIPRGKSLKGRSVCPYCKKTIIWIDNIPILSYIFLRGRCRKCKKKISLRYPIIELFCGLLFMLVWIIFIISSGIEPLATLNTYYGYYLLPILLFIVVITLSIFVIDFIHQIIPDSLSLSTLAAFLILLTLFDVPGYYQLLLVSFLTSIFLLLIHLVTAGRGMGLGDVKLALMLSLLLPFPYQAVLLFAAFLTGAVVGIILILAKKASFGMHIAFGPFLIAGYWIALVFGEYLIKLFLI